MLCEAGVGGETRPWEPLARVAEGWGSEVLDYFVLIYLGRGSWLGQVLVSRDTSNSLLGNGDEAWQPGAGPQAAAGVVTGEWHRVELECPSMLLRASHAHQTLLFFRNLSVKDSSFVEKMKKTVSFHYVCTLPNESWPGGCLQGPAEGQLHWTGEGGWERRPGSLVCTFSSNQSPNVALLLLGEFTVFLNKPNYKNRPSL